MKTAELIGPTLDHWVAKALGYYEDDTHAAQYHYLINDAKLYGRAPTRKEFRPSTDWLWGGPIIERERITVRADFSTEAPNDWAAMGSGFYQEGPTALIAAMRAYVASKFGEEVGDET